MAILSIRRWLECCLLFIQIQRSAQAKNTAQGKAVTIAVDRYGASCPAPASPLGTSTITSTSTRFGGTTAGIPYASTTSAPGPIAACIADPCPSLESRRCIDSSGVTYRIKCDASLDGAVMFWPGVRKRANANAKQKRQVKKRGYVEDFAECLQHCDPVAGCRGASYDDTYHSCWLYGPLIGFVDEVGSVAAIRLTFPQDGVGTISAPFAPTGGNWTFSSARAVMTGL